VTPGAGDAPIWTSTEWGKTLFQYKRFGTAVMQKATVAGLQRRDMEALSGLAAVSGLGVLGTALRDITKDGQVEDRTPQQWIVEGADRGGLLMLFTELNAIMDKATGISAIRAITGEEPSRFGPRSLVGQLFGPTAGTIFDTQDLLRSITDAALGEQEFTTSDLRRIRRMIPGQNLFYLRKLFNELETRLAEGAGIPEPR